MSKKSVVCTVKTRQQAETILDRLHAAGFSYEDVSVVFPDKEGTRDFAHENSTKAPEGAATGAGAGGVLGGTLGLLAGIGALAIPGLGPFIAAGPIMAALSGMAVGAAVGGITGALIGMGIPEYEAKIYEGRIKNGSILMSVHAENSEEVARAKAIVAENGADDISSVTEAGVARHDNWKDEDLPRSESSVPRNTQPGDWVNDPERSSRMTQAELNREEQLRKEAQARNNR